jgi:hypothetical protein
MAIAPNLIPKKRGYSLCNIRGDSFNLEVILVKADIKIVSEALAEIVYGIVKVDVDIHNLGDKIHAVVLQYRGHTWSLFTFFTSQPDLAQRLSKSLETKCIQFGYSDTSDSGEYILYERGVRVEAYAFGCNYSEDEVPGWPGITNGFQEEPVIVFEVPWNLISITSDQSSHYSFYSLGKKVTIEEVQDSDNFLNSMFLSQDAWLPPLEYWLPYEIEAEIDSNIFEQVNVISYKSIL